MGNSNNWNHAAVTVAGIAALVVLVIYGGVSGNEAVPIIALAMGLTGGVAATTVGANQAQAASLPPAPARAAPADPAPAPPNPPAAGPA